MKMRMQCEKGEESAQGEEGENKVKRQSTEAREERISSRGQEVERGQGRKDKYIQEGKA